jgi:N-acyl-D-amino-acid deacylase
VKLDYLLQGGVIIDGAGKDSEPIKKDIGIKGDRIVFMGEACPTEAHEVIDLDGLIISPGFIDCHGHSEFTLFADGRAQAKVSQGVTTEINGNCGVSAAPLVGEGKDRREADHEEFSISDRWSYFEDYYEKLTHRGIAINFATLTGHGTIRASTIGYANREPQPHELEQMIHFFRDSLEFGVLGLSTGLIYPPGIFAHAHEIAALAHAAKPFHGIYTTHLRSEGDNLLDAIDEALSIASQSGLNLHLSHLKTQGRKNWHKIDQVFDKIEKAHSDSLSVTCDRYPYTASSTDLDTVLPPSVFEGGYEAALNRLKNYSERIKAEILASCDQEYPWQRVVISSVNHDKNKWMEGLSLDEIAIRENMNPLDMLFELLIDECLRVGALFFTMSEDNLRLILKKPYCVIGSDSSARNFDGVTKKGKPHPRAFGTFPRIVSTFVNDESILTLSQAIHKMTGLTARIFGIQDRGIVGEGFYADIVVFDKERIRDRATYRDPFQRPEGIEYVFTNGIPTLWKGELTENLPGRVLTKGH